MSSFPCPKYASENIIYNSINYECIDEIICKGRLNPWNREILLIVTQIVSIEVQKKIYMTFFACYRKSCA